MPDISVVIPTVSGREDYLKACIDAYETNTAGTVEIHTFKDLPGVAYGWQRGAELATGRYLHLTCDDILPEPGWDVPAAAMADDGWQPAPRLLNVDGSQWRNGNADDPWLLTHGTPTTMSTLPFMARGWWPDVTPLPPGMHYFADNWVSWRLQESGRRTAVCHGYDFTHSWAQEHRGAGWSENERVTVDQQYAGIAMKVIQVGAHALTTTH